MHPSNWSAVQSVFHGRVPCDLNGDGVIETSDGEENGCYALGKQYLGTPPDKPKTSFTGLAFTSNLAGVSFGIGVGTEDTGVDNVASTTNEVEIIYPAYQLRTIFAPLALMKFVHRILIVQSGSYNLCFYQVLPVSASPDLSSFCFLTYAQYLGRFPVYSCRFVDLLPSVTFSAELNNVCFV